MTDPFAILSQITLTDTEQPLFSIDGYSLALIKRSMDDHRKMQETIWLLWGQRYTETLESLWGNQ